jgi:hypothetical protein
MGDEASCGDRSLLELLRHLARDNETVELELAGDTSSKEGKLVAAETAYVTLVTDSSTHAPGSGTSSHLKVFYIPVHKIVAVAEL